MKEFITIGAKLTKDEERGMKSKGETSSGSTWKGLLRLFELDFAGTETLKSLSKWQSRLPFLTKEDNSAAGGHVALVVRD